MRRKARRLVGGLSSRSLANEWYINSVRYVARRARCTVIVPWVLVLRSSSQADLPGWRAYRQPVSFEQTGKCLPQDGGHRSLFVPTMMPSCRWVDSRKLAALPTYGADDPIPPLFQWSTTYRHMQFGRTRQYVGHGQTTKLLLHYFRY